MPKTIQEEMRREGEIVKELCHLGRTIRWASTG